MSRIDYIIMASYGNDSIALIQWAKERGLQNVVCLFNNTGWGSNKWMNDRLPRGEAFAESCGFETARTTSEGMISLVKRKKGWPAGGGVGKGSGGGAGQFCTKYLKVEPSIEWMDTHDPEKRATCLAGIRRAESTHRQTAPEFIEESERHGGREVWHPLVRHTDEQRNELIARAGFEVLDHRSEECFPCVNANIDDLRRVSEDRIELIDVTEQEMGNTKNGKPRVMFRPARHKKATGIREVIRWAKVLRKRDQDELFSLGNGAGCDSGYCGG